MRNWLKGAGLVLAGGLVVGLFWYVVARVESGDQKASATDERTAISGNYNQYFYTITTEQAENKRQAQFDPPLPPDDSVVLPALKSLAKDAFAAVIPDDEQPVVETVNETNFVTFSLGKAKFSFELFQNSKGQVATAYFTEQGFPILNLDY